MTDINNVSHTYVRDPSIVWPGIRPLPALRKKLFKSIDGTFEDSKKEPIKIYLRIKPELQKDNVFVPPESQTFKVVNGTTLTARCVKQTSHGKSLVSHRYTFTKIFEGDVEQKYLFENSVQDAVKDFVCGKNALLFAYGTTNAGKTHTMIGDTNQPGIVPRSIHALFLSIHGNLGSSKLKPCNVTSVVQLDDDALAKEMEFKHRILQWNPQAADTTSKSSTHSQVSDDSCLSKPLCNTFTDDSSDFISYSFREMEDRLKEDKFQCPYDDGTKYTVWVSFAEVYNESIFDLLETRSGKDKERKNLMLGTDNQGHTFIKGLRSVPVVSGDEAYHVMLYGKHNLRCSATNLNDVSSRSHCIFTIKLVRSPNTDAPTHASVSTYSFCDLAGSERVKKTLNEGKQLAESININTSLLVLGKCLKTIRDNQKGQGRFDQSIIPFRESKLTRLFHRALLGQQKVAMIVNISTDHILLPETLHVLKFSAIAKQIVLEPPPRVRSMKQSTRFSQIASKHSKRQTIPWETTDGDITGCTNQSCGDMSRQDEGQSLALLALAEDLKKQLQSERKKNLALETDLRKELTQKFAKMLEDVEARHKQSIEEMELEQEQFVAWRTKDLQQFYEKSEKRKRCDDNDDFTDTVIIGELQNELDNLKQENEVLRDLHEKSLQQTEKLRIANSQLQFESSNLKQLLDTANETFQAIGSASNDTDLSKLQSQLTSALADVVAKQSTIEHLKTLLDEAKLEYEKFTSENQILEVENRKWEQLLAEKEDALEEAVNSCAQSRAQLMEFKTSKKMEIRQMKATIQDLNNQISKLQATSESLLKAAPQFPGPEGDTSCLKCTPDLFEKQALQLKLASLEEELCNLRIKPTLEEENRELLVKLESAKSGSHTLQSELEVLREFNKSLCTQLEAQKLGSLDKEAECRVLQSELEVLREVNKSLCTQLEAQKLGSSDKEAESHVLHSELEALRDANKTLISQLEALQNEHSRKEEEIDSMQKGIKSTLQTNMQLKETLELQNRETLALQRELKDTVKAMRNAEQAYHLEKENNQTLKINFQCETERFRMQLSTYAQSEEFVRSLQQEDEKRITELAQLKEENDAFIERIAAMNSDLDLLKERRDKQFKQYEDIIRNQKEEVDRQKREVKTLQDWFYKKTPTPVKNDQLRRLQEEIQMKDSEINRLQKEVQVFKLQYKLQEQSLLHNNVNLLNKNERVSRKPMKSGDSGSDLLARIEPAKPKSTPYRVSQKPTSELDGDNNSEDEYVPKRSARKTASKRIPASERKARKETKENDPDQEVFSCQKSQSKRKDTPAHVLTVKDEHASTEKSQKKKVVAKKKLFSHSDSLTELEPDESEHAPLSTTLNPIDYVMRSLRSRPK